MTRRILILDGHPDPATAQIQSSSYLLPVEDQNVLAPRCNALGAFRPGACLRLDHLAFEQLLEPAVVAVDVF